MRRRVRFGSLADYWTDSSSMSASRGIGLASEKRTVELSPHCPFFELNGADIADGSMASFSVVEALDVIEHICTGFIPGSIFSSIDALTFE